MRLIKFDRVSLLEFDFQFYFMYDNHLLIIVTIYVCEKSNQINFA